MHRRWGVVSFADSLDCVGILAPSSRGIEQIFGLCFTHYLSAISASCTPCTLDSVDVVAQPDAKDPTAIAQDLRNEAKSMANARIEQSYRGTGCESPFSGLKVGVPKVDISLHEREAAGMRR
jgi:Asp-tRNA(Asn)/Glu-tRNA(Gln) amidotransferase A subunit family amidase